MSILWSFLSIITLIALQFFKNVDAGDHLFENDRTNLFGFPFWAETDTLMPQPPRGSESSTLFLRGIILPPAAAEGDHSYKFLQASYRVEVALDNNADAASSQSQQKEDLFAPSNPDQAWALTNKYGAFIVDLRKIFSNPEKIKECKLVVRFLPSDIVDQVWKNACAAHFDIDNFHPLIPRFYKFPLGQSIGSELKPVEIMLLESEKAKMKEQRQLPHMISFSTAPLPVPLSYATPRMYNYNPIPLSTAFDDVPSSSTNPFGAKKKRFRTKITSEQKEKLINDYNKNKYPGHKGYEELRKVYKFPRKITIPNWFRNRRQMEKKQQNQDQQPSDGLTNINVDKYGTDAALPTEQLEIENQPLLPADQLVIISSEEDDEETEDEINPDPNDEIPVDLKVFAHNKSAEDQQPQQHDKGDDIGGAADAAKRKGKEQMED